VLAAGPALRHVARVALQPRVDLRAATVVDDHLRGPETLARAEWVGERSSPPEFHDTGALERVARHEHDWVAIQARRYGAHQVLRLLRTQRCG
jgi:hypothetical protein